ncbi:MAG TPA: thioredoxin [Anaerolineae bacterium]|nr:thioredoxin [Anaerolineae bacterium]
MVAELNHISDDTFEAQVIEAEQPVLVDFGADWCHPCRQLDPIVSELADELHGKVKVAKFNIDTNMKTPVRYGVMGVPTLILFINGEDRERVIGYQSKKRILAQLEPHLKQS